MDVPEISVARMFRYPVKSMGGEEVDALDLEPAGVVGDRLWSLLDVERRATVSARRLPAALRLRARWSTDPVPGADRSDPPAVVVTLPDGSEVSSGDAGTDGAISGVLDREVRLVRLPREKSGYRLPARESIAMSDPAVLARDFGVDDDERLPDFSRMDLASLLQLTRYGTPPGTFVDVGRVHLLTEASLRAAGAAVRDGDGAALPVQRFRPNLLLTHPDDGLPEADWVGATLTLGTARLEVVMPTLRCVVPSREHRLTAGEALPVDRGVTRAVAEAGGRYLGAYAAVAALGRVRVGDSVTLTHAASTGRLATAAGRARDSVVRGAMGAADAARRRPARGR